MQKISVIVPIYNSEQYIYECIKSVTGQTFPEFELILVDDGSADNSRVICEKEGEKDSRIRLIYQEHKGVSEARNIGMDAATGKYLFFLDSDDMIHPQLLEKLYELQEKKHTIIATEGVYYVTEDEFYESISWEIEENQTNKSFYLDNEKAKKYRLSGGSRVALDSIGGKMILHEAIKSIRFNRKLSHCEDTLFLYQLIDKGADISVLCNSWYYYRRHKNSSTKNYSIDSCKSRYIAERYICNNDIKNGRILDAISVEWSILCELLKWNNIAKRNGDENLRKFVYNLISIEKKLLIYQKMGSLKKLTFIIGNYSYAIFKLVLCLTTIIIYRNSYTLGVDSIKSRK